VVRRGGRDFARDLAARPLGAPRAPRPAPRDAVPASRTKGGPPLKRQSTVALKNIAAVSFLTTNKASERHTVNKL